MREIVRRIAHSLISFSISNSPSNVILFTSFSFSGGHVNPSVTIGLASTGKFPWRRVPIYFLIQFLAAMVACLICFLCYYGEFTCAKK